MIRHYTESSKFTEYLANSTNVVTTVKHLFAITKLPLYKHLWWPWKKSNEARDSALIKDYVDVIW